MSEAPPIPAADGSRRIYVLWGVGLGLLAALALVCWLAVGPVLQVRRLADLHRQGRLTESEVVAQLGGQERAVSKLLLHLRVALKISADRYTRDVLEVLCCCEVPASPAPFGDLRAIKVVIVLCLHGVGDGGWEGFRSIEHVERARARLERRQRWAAWFAGKQPPPQPPSGPSPD